jgi:phage tail-like protein
MKRFRFPAKPLITVEWGNIQKPLLEVLGLSIEIEVLELRDGANPENAHKVPGRYKYPNVILKHCIKKGDLDFYNWIHAINNNHVVKQHVLIHLKDKKNFKIRTWKIFNPWPCKVNFTDLNANGNTTAIEVVEFAHKGLEIIP